MSKEHGPVEAGVKHGFVAGAILGAGWITDRLIESKTPGQKSEIGNKTAMTIIALVVSKEAVDGWTENKDA